MKRYLKFAALGLAAYLVALVVTVPASQVLPRAGDYLTKNNIRLSATGIDGSLWSGRMATAVINDMPLGQTEWTVKPWHLLAGELRAGLRLTPEGGYVNGDLGMSRTGWSLHGLDGRLPARTAMRYLPRFPLPAELDGTFSLQVDELVWRDGKAEAVAATVIWHQAALTLSSRVKLGDLKFVLKPGENGALAGDISDGGGPLAIKGDLNVNPDRTYRLNANVSTRPGADPAIASVLPLLGRTDNKGGYNVTWAGSL